MIGFILPKCDQSDESYEQLNGQFYTCHFKKVSLQKHFFSIFRDNSFRRAAAKKDVTRDEAHAGEQDAATLKRTNTTEMDKAKEVFYAVEQRVDLDEFDVVRQEVDFEESSSNAFLNNANTEELKNENCNNSAKCLNVEKSACNEEVSIDVAEKSLNVDSIFVSKEPPCVVLPPKSQNSKIDKDMSCMSTEELLDILLDNDELSHDSHVDNSACATSAVTAKEYITASGEDFSLTEGCKKKQKIETKRVIVDPQYMFDEFLRAFPTCLPRDIQFCCKQPLGMASRMKFKCFDCGKLKWIYTEDVNDERIVPINDAGVLSTYTSGIGYAQFSEIFANMETQCMAPPTYSKCEKTVSKAISDTLKKRLIEASEEEARLARARGDVINGIPFITVIVDGSWQKRSYGKSFNSNSGMAVITGHCTGKILYIGSKNKYCCICARLKNASNNDNMIPKKHDCKKNWREEDPSTGMESAIIVEGFKESVETHGLIYRYIIQDGDSSVSKRIEESNPYSAYGVEVVGKFECINHLMRNMCNRIDSITNHGPQRTHELRSTLQNNKMSLRQGILAAAKYLRESNHSTAESADKLRKAINVLVQHIFGEHKDCSIIPYINHKKEESKNLLAEMIKSELWDPFTNAISRVLGNASSLIFGATNNLAECYNNVNCKVCNAKRTNIIQRGRYSTDCEVAAIQFNSQNVGVDII